MTPNAYKIWWLRESNHYILWPSSQNALYNAGWKVDCKVPLLADCKDEDINDVYKRDIERMERIIMSKSGIVPFLVDSLEQDVPGFFYFEVFTNYRWTPRRRH